MRAFEDVSFCSFHKTHHSTHKDLLELREPPYTTQGESIFAVIYDSLFSGYETEMLHCYISANKSYFKQCWGWGGTFCGKPSKLILHVSEVLLGSCSTLQYHCAPGVKMSSCPPVSN